MDNLIGQRLDGRYQIDELIGEGGMANVYRGTDLLSNDTVAVKVLKNEFRQNEELVRRFKNESRAISVLNHPCIVKVFDVSVSDKIQYIVMEFIDGITLKEYIEQRGEPLTYKEVVHFTGQILQCLQHAHAKGIVHRDVKPQNIMIREDGTIKVMDFGIARLARSEIHTAGEQAIGSVHYISPEQAQGADTDPRADIYSVGIMMYEMLSGRLPFEDENAVQVAIKQISDMAVPIRQVNPSVPEGLEAIAMKAMAKDPAQRYQDALDMLRDIEEFKRDPSIKFEYDYMGDAPAKVVGRVMSDSKRGRTGGAAPSNAKRRRPRHKRRVGLLVPIVLGLTIAVVGTSVAAAVNVVNNSSSSIFGEYEDVELPDFVGDNYSNVEKALKSEDLRNLRVTIDQEYNPSVPEGTVISQNPISSKAAPKMVKANQALRLVVSRGIETVKIPETAGMTRNEATKAIQEMGLRPYAKSVTDSGVPAGKVIGTEPEAGTMVQNVEGTVITILVSSIRANYEVNVPDVTGVDLEAAQRLLDNMGLMIGQVKMVESEEPEGTVLAQTPVRGTLVGVASDVHLTVAKAVEPPPEEPPPEAEKKTVPDVVGSSVSNAIKALNAAGFNANVTSEIHSLEPAGTILSQSIDGGTEATEGATVNLRVSLGPRDTTPDPPESEEPPPDPVSVPDPVVPEEPEGETGTEP